MPVLPNSSLPAETREEIPQRLSVSETNRLAGSIVEFLDSPLTSQA